MSLFECCWAPERRSSRVEQALPVIPSEIYLNIIDLIVPPTMATMDLAPNQLKILCNLSRVCKLFANICLPRLYESVELSGPPTRYCDPTYKALLGSVLCTQIAEKQPLALALAQTVRACCVGVWRDALYAKRCIVAVSHMKNIRKFEFSQFTINAMHWSMIVALPSLEDLSFDACRFLQGFASTEAEMNPKLKLSRLRVIDCTWGSQLLFAAIDLVYLRMVIMNLWAVEDADWLRHSAITELDLYSFEDSMESDLDFTPELSAVLVNMPRSLEVLRFSAGEIAACNIAADISESMMEDPAWKDLSSLCSFTLRVDEMLNMDYRDSELVLSMNNSVSRMESILHDKLGPFATLSDLKHVEYLGKVFRLVDAEWVECLV